MRGVRYLLTATMAIILMLACQKELSFDNNVSTGSLKSASTGDCLPSTVVGNYQQDSVLTNANYIDVHVNIVNPGTFVVKSDTLNGYSFFKAGTLGITGDNIVRLYATGKPIAAGVNTFSIKFGTSVCTVAVMVTGPGGGGGGTAIYTLGGAPGICTGASANGTYTAGVPLTASNTLTVTVNVTTLGTFTIGALPVNGIAFGTTGTFTTLGVQTLTLNSTGTPTAGGIFNYNVTDGTNTCVLAVNILPAIPPAVLTLTGGPGNCLGFTLGGTYTAGTPLTAANTATVNLTVTTTGSYSFASNTVNGVSFSAAGNFLTAGVQTVILKGTGTPTASGPFNYVVTGNGSNCTMSVTFAAPAPPATFTLTGAPATCTAATVAGIYTTGTALGSTNTVQLSVNVTVAGSYTLSTNTVNGISFTGAGTFTATGIQNITLTGTGTPVAAGTTTLTPTIGTSNCTFDVTVVAGVPGIYTCKINGVFNAFNDRAEAQTDDGFGNAQLYLDGYTGPANGGVVPEFQIFIIKNDGSAVGTGTYNVDGLLLPNGYQIEIDYTLQNPDLTTTIWNTSSSLLSPNPPFTVVVTSITATRVKGTFSGTLTNTAQGSTQTKTITEGVFDLPIQ